MQRNRNGEILEGSPESKSMAWGKRSVSGTSEASIVSSKEVGNGNERSVTDEHRGVRSRSSTQRSGKPITGGRMRRNYVACKETCSGEKVRRKHANQNCGEKQMKRKSRQVTESSKCTILICGDGDMNGSLIGESLCFVRKRVVSKSPVRKNCTPGSVRGRRGNPLFYLDER